MLAALLSEFGGYLIAGLAVLATLAGAYFTGKSNGRVEEGTRRDTKINEQAAQARQEAQEVRNETAAMDDDAVAAELADKWVRKPAGKGGR